MVNTLTSKIHLMTPKHSPELNIKKNSSFSILECLISALEDLYGGEKDLPLGVSSPKVLRSDIAGQWSPRPVSDNVCQEFFRCTKLSRQVHEIATFNF